MCDKETILSSESVQVIGFVHAYLCSMVDQGKDIRKIEVPQMLEDVEFAFKNPETSLKL